MYIYVHQGDVIETNWDDLRVFLALALIRKYEGTLDRFTGDGMLVFFNDPLPCPDAPDRAARLAIRAGAGTATEWASASAWPKATPPWGASVSRIVSTTPRSAPS